MKAVANRWPPRRITVLALMLALLILAGLALLFMNDHGQSFLDFSAASSANTQRNIPIRAQLKTPENTIAPVVTIQSRLHQTTQIQIEHVTGNVSEVTRAYRVAPTRHNAMSANTLSWVLASHDNEESKASVTSQKCESMFGITFVDFWRSKRYPLCKAAAGSEIPPLLSSHLVSYPMVYPNLFFPEGGGGGRSRHEKTNILESFNVVFDTRSFTAEADQATEGDPRPKAGSIKSSCVLDSQSEAWALTDLRGTREIARSALQAGLDLSVLRPCNASTAKEEGLSIVEHTVLLLHRYDTSNSYHNLEDIVSVFVTLAVLNSSDVLSQGIQVIISDQKRLGLFPEIWERLSLPYPLRILYKDVTPGVTCFRHIIHPAFASPSLFHSFWQYPRLKEAAKAEGKRYCRSSIVTGASHWLRSLFPEITALKREVPTDIQTQVQGVPLKTYAVLWISRRNYEKIHKNRLNSWQATRVASNEDELILALSKEILDWNNNACFRRGGGRSAASFKYSKRTLQEEKQQRYLQQQNGCRDKAVVFELQVMELSDTAFYPDQLIKLTRMRILMGVHGAGMSNMIWMTPEQGGVVEVMHNAGGGNLHYANMAGLLNHTYVAVESGGPTLNIVNCVNALKEVMDAVS